ncbi:hypothetical protein GCM10020331_093390 [Ectobacillus funiculus]
MQEVSQPIDEEYIYDNIKENNFAFVLLQELKKNLGVYEYSFVWDLSHIGYEIYEEGLAIFNKASHYRGPFILRFQRH